MPKQKTIKLYTKVCARCMWPAKMNLLQSYAQNKGAKLKIMRTAYRPDWHKKATEIYGSEDYTAFIYEGGRVKDFISWTGKTKAKPVKNTKAKRTKKTKAKKAKKNDLRELPEAKGSDREDSVAVAQDETKTED